jgi:hypothetical protein
VFPIKLFIAIGLVLLFASVLASAYRGTPFGNYEILVDVAVGILLLTVSSAARRGRSERYP